MVCKISITIALGIALLVAPAGADQHTDDLQERINQLEEQQRQFQAELERLRQEVKERETEVAAEAPEERVAEVERKQGVLTDEVRKLREVIVLPETKELKSYYGLGPAASKIYQIERGLSIGGYGESSFRTELHDSEGKDDEFDFLRFVLYVGYKYNDWIVLNSEIEFEHATDGATVSSSDGSVSVEFANLDFLFHEKFNVRAGLMLVPIGFINQIHEPPFFLGNRRPPVERQIIPSTWRSNGVGLFGELLPGLTYNAYGITSFNAKGYSESNLRSARQSGNREKANDWSFVGRLDYDPNPAWGWTMGGTVYVGDQGQDEKYGPEDMQRRAGVFTQIYEIHTQVNYRKLHFRALGTTVVIDDAALLSLDPDINGPIAESMYGVYTEIGYDILPLIFPDTTHSLMPWFRYSWLDTQNGMPNGFARDRSQRRDYYEVGLQYKPIPQVVLKAEYRIEDRQEGTAPDGLQLGGGFVF
jgi:hypothetical protein